MSILNTYEIKGSGYISLWDTMDALPLEEAIFKFSAQCSKAIADFLPADGSIDSSQVTTRFDLEEYGMYIEMTRPMTESERNIQDSAEKRLEESRVSRDRELFEELQKKYGW